MAGQPAVGLVGTQSCESHLQGTRVTPGIYILLGNTVGVAPLAAAPVLAVHRHSGSMLAWLRRVVHCFRKATSEWQQWGFN